MVVLAGHPTGSTAYPGRSARSPRRGAAAVEFAVVANVFFIVVLGVIEIGRGFMVVEQLNGAAADGARQGSLKSATSDDVQSAVSAFMKGQGLTDSSGKSLGTVKIYDNGSLVYTSGGSSVSVASGHQIKVEIWVPISAMTWIPGGKNLGVANNNYLVGHAVLVAE